MSDTQYAPAVGSKFYEDGRVKQFPGNTIICFADPQGRAYQEAEWVQTQLTAQSYGHKFAMLPPSSFHMTVFELICDDVRQMDKWLSGLDLDAPLAATDEYFIKTVAQVPKPDNFRMNCTHFNAGTVGLALYLEPADDETVIALKAYRNAIADATGVRSPHHDQYAFHLSLAYWILKLTDEEKVQLKQLAKTINARLHESFGVFDTGKPVLTFFDDMFDFVPSNQRHTLKSRQ